MKTNELIDANYYFLQFTRQQFICKSAGGDKCGDYVNITDKTFTQRSVGIRWRTDVPCSIRKASRREVKYLQNCIKAGKYLEPSKSYLSYFLCF